MVNGALWLIENTFDHKSGQFRYTSCENRSVGGGFQQTQWVIEGLSYAYFFSRNELIEKYLINAIDTIGKYPENLDHLGLGKAIAQQMRYTPLYFICSQRMYKSDFLLADRISIVSDEISEDFTAASSFANKLHIKNFELRKFIEGRIPDISASTFRNLLEKKIISITHTL